MIQLFYAFSKATFLKLLRYVAGEKARMARRLLGAQKAAGFSLDAVGDLFCSLWVSSLTFKEIPNTPESEKLRETRYKHQDAHKVSLPFEEMRICIDTVCIDSQWHFWLIKGGFRLIHPTPRTVEAFGNLSHSTTSILGNWDGMSRCSSTSLSISKKHYSISWVVVQ